MVSQMRPHSVSVWPAAVVDELGAADGVAAGSPVWPEVDCGEPLVPPQAASMRTTGTVSRRRRGRVDITGV
jgi:hypothetical protein